MVELFHKADPETVRLADHLLHDPKAHSIAHQLDTCPDAAQLIREMEGQAKHLHQDLPPMVIMGLTEHLVNEAKQGINISAEYNSLSNPDKVSVAAEFVHEKTRNMTIQEDVNGRLSSVEVAIGSGVTRPVYEPDHKIKDVLHAGARIQF